MFRTSGLETPLDKNYVQRPLARSQEDTGPSEAEKKKSKMQRTCSWSEGLEIRKRWGLGTSCAFMQLPKDSSLSLVFPSGAPDSIEAGAARRTRPPSSHHLSGSCLFQGQAIFRGTGNYIL